MGCFFYLVCGRRGFVVVFVGRRWRVSFYLGVVLGRKGCLERGEMWWDDGFEWVVVELVMGCCFGGDNCFY